MSELAGQKKMMEFLGKEKPRSEEQKGDKTTPEATPRAKQEDFILVLKDKIGRILEKTWRRRYKNKINRRKASVCVR